MVMFLDFGITLEQFGLLNAAWAAAIVLLEMRPPAPSPTSWAAGGCSWRRPD